MQRLAVISDLDAVFDIYMHESVIPYLGFDPMPKRAFGPIFHSLVTSRSFYVYTQGAIVVGFYGVQRHEGRAAHVACLGTLAIAPAHQGKGFGSAMVMSAIARLKVTGVTRVELMVEADNPSAIAFYERLGFQHEGTMRRAYKRASDQTYTDELVYALLLESRHDSE
jgi:RimJ/RimL family protein N-acetyltransferase